MQPSVCTASDSSSRVNTSTNGMDTPPLSSLLLASNNVCLPHSQSDLRLVFAVQSATAVPLVSFAANQTCAAISMLRSESLSWLLFPAKGIGSQATPIQSSELICLLGRDKREWSKTHRECRSNSRTPIQSDRHDCSPSAGLCTHMECQRPGGCSCTTCSRFRGVCVWLLSSETLERQLRDWSPGSASGILSSAVVTRRAPKSCVAIATQANQQGGVKA